MQTSLALLLASLLLSLLLTPLASQIGIRFGIVDIPSKRKVHSAPIPRIGGVAIFLAFLLPLAGWLYFSGQLNKGFFDPGVFWVMGGAAIVFLLGLADDIFRLRPAVKFSIQILSALMACHGGLSISHIALPLSISFHLGWFSIPVTVFWFLLVVNAINLTDGLDGLAAGVSLFVCLSLFLLGIMHENYQVSMCLAALAGACIGFLYFNFNPASIFMGDSGSYFLGFMIAALSIFGSVKSQAAVAILVPVAALGVPLFDTILAPIRRFILGKDPFMPDKGHLHHRLLRMGLTQRRAVLVMYAVTAGLGFMAILLVYARSWQSCLILVILCVGAILTVKKIGYIKHIAVSPIVRYLQEVMDSVGLMKDRRKFLYCQVCIGRSENHDELWQCITDAAELLRIDDADLELNDWTANGRYHWEANGTRHIGHNGNSREFMSLQLPLRTDKVNYGLLHLSKDLQGQPLKRHTLKRIEHLKWDIVQKLKELEEE
jgi:UDP-GlcNAc:undecaprenyl-phosphate GlcNAc-1-phosphate transferase